MKSPEYCIGNHVIDILLAAKRRRLQRAASPSESSGGTTMALKAEVAAVCVVILAVYACSSSAATIGSTSGLPGLDASLDIDAGSKLPFFVSWMLKNVNVSAKVKTQWAELNANVTFPTSGPSRCTEKNGTLLGNIVACPYSTVHISDGLLDRPVHYQVCAPPPQPRTPSGRRWATG